MKAEPASPGGVPFAGRSILIIEDHDDALAMATAWQPDVVLLDIGLPVMDGYEVARRLRAQAIPLRLVALTGYGQPEDLRRSAQAGFDGHLVKPVGMEALAAAINA